MSSVNKVILVGRLGKDPETRYMQNGDAVTNVTLATEETWKKDGEKQSKTEWHRLTFYRKLAEIVEQYLNKGSLIYVEGRIETRKWQDQLGNDKYSTEIIVNEMRMLGGGQSSPSQVANSQPKSQPQNQSAPEDDDIPF